MPDHHIIIVGGVSVNDPGGHDRYPYNFINPGVMRAREYLKAEPGSKVIMFIFAPPYEKRVMYQGVDPPGPPKAMAEHAKVTVGTITKCEPFLWVFETCTTVKNTRHFIDIAGKSAKDAGFDMREIRTADELTDALKLLRPIKTIDYFGHSSADAMFLSYNTDQSRFSGGEVTWGMTDAAKIPSSQFASGAAFYSFGCYQGDSGGLAQQIRAVWPGVTAHGSDGFSHFETIGQGKPFPRSDNGWYKYPAHTGRGAPPARVLVPEANLKVPAP
jgi:hypothetical protein